MYHQRHLTTAERFAQKYEPEPNSGCWLWNAAGTPNGYGQFWFRGSHWLAHRASYEMHVGPIPEGLELDHKCRVRCCVNPAHLEPVTHQENARRGDAGAYKSRQTHCPHGHEFSGENLAFASTGQRLCRTCRREAHRRYAEKMRRAA